MSVILNAANNPLGVPSGTVPNVGGALLDWFQPMTFGVVTKVVTSFQVAESVVDTSFMGVIQPLTDRLMNLKPEGQRAWTWLWLHSDPSLILDVDDVVIYRGKQTRVMTRKAYDIYGYIDYHLVQDWEGSGP